MLHSARDLLVTAVQNAFHILHPAASVQLANIAVQGLTTDDLLKILGHNDEPRWREERLRDQTMAATKTDHLYQAKPSQLELESRLYPMLLKAKVKYAEELKNAKRRDIKVTWRVDSAAPDTMLLMQPSQAQALMSAHSKRYADVVWNVERPENGFHIVLDETDLTTLRLATRGLPIVYRENISWSFDGRQQAIVKRKLPVPVRPFEAPPPLPAISAPLEPRPTPRPEDYLGEPAHEKIRAWFIYKSVQNRIQEGRELPEEPIRDIEHRILADRVHNRKMSHWVDAESAAAREPIRREVLPQSGAPPQHPVGSIADVPSIAEIRQRLQNTARSIEGQQSVVAYISRLRAQETQNRQRQSDNMPKKLQHQRPVQQRLQPNASRVPRHGTGRIVTSHVVRRGMQQTGNAHRRIRSANADLAVRESEPAILSSSEESCSSDSTLDSDQTSDDAEDASRTNPVQQCNSEAVVGPDVVGRSELEVAQQTHDSTEQTNRQSFDIARQSNNDVVPQVLSDADREGRRQTSSSIPAHTDTSCESTTKDGIISDEPGTTREGSTPPPTEMGSKITASTQPSSTLPAFWSPADALSSDLTSSDIEHTPDRSAHNRSRADSNLSPSPSLFKVAPTIDDRVGDNDSMFDCSPPLSLLYPTLSNTTSKYLSRVNSSSGFLDCLPNEARSLPISLVKGRSFSHLMGSAFAWISRRRAFSAPAAPLAQHSYDKQEQAWPKQHLGNRPAQVEEQSKDRVCQGHVMLDGCASSPDEHIACALRHDTAHTQVPLVFVAPNLLGKRSPRPRDFALDSAAPPNLRYRRSIACLRANLNPQRGRVKWTDFATYPWAPGSVKRALIAAKSLSMKRRSSAPGLLERYDLPHSH